jgi:hypothetical protein
MRGVKISGTCGAQDVVSGELGHSVMGMAGGWWLSLRRLGRGQEIQYFRDEDRGGNAVGGGVCLSALSGVHPPVRAMLVYGEGFEPATASV